VEVPLSPKFQDHAVGVLMEVSVKATVKGTVPLVGLPEKFATGALPPPVEVGRRAMLSIAFEVFTLLTASVSL
jgi:hypothetical protein